MLIPQEDKTHPILAIDYGQARTGLAATDEFGICAFPVETLEGEEGLVEKVAKIAKNRHIATILIGIPLGKDGNETSSATRIRAFGEQLRQALPEIPLIYLDESHTTTTASSKLTELKHKPKREKELLDQIAALEILNDYLGESY